MQFRFDHYNIRTAKVEETVRFYSECLGFTPGYAPAPPGSQPAPWLVDQDGRPVVHLLPLEPDGSVPEQARPYMEDREVVPHSGTIDHVAFSAKGREELKKRLDAAGIPYRERDTLNMPTVRLVQLFLTDPNGILIELNFRDEIDFGKYAKTEESQMLPAETP